MISFVRGIVAWKEDAALTVDVGGIGLRLQTPLRDAEKIKIDETVLLHTYFAVREDAMELYGFSDREDLELFHKLLSVSGVGPKAALSLLSSFTASELAAAIVLSDSKKISSAQGIGNKTAQRIILELKEKISNESLTAGIEGGASPSEALGVEAEAVSALTALGYTQAEAQQAVKKAGGRATTEETVKAALLMLMR